MISSGFYLLFFLVPLVFTSQTSELFEYNKMMTVYALTIYIVGAWIIKMIMTKKFIYRRTLLEIPLLIYLGSHLLSTLFSIDPHVSIWGYYSRFHEGLLASLCYVLLYFAAVSNLTAEHVKKIFLLSFISASIVSVWGLLEHYGHSISCLAITGDFGVDCWIQDVKNRVFATLGQPNWMAAYLAILIPIALAFKNRLRYLALLFFAALLFTKSRSGVLGLGVALFILVSFWGAKRLQNLLRNPKEILDPARLAGAPAKRARMTVTIGFAIIAFTFGLPFSQIEKYSLENFLSSKPANQQTSQPAPSGYIDIGISESSDIRKIVWEGAVKIWQRYPVLGSGVETFAYAYYKDRPVAHNMVSEWDFLYNKAHNEYLNILATTGTVGMIAYLIVIASAAKQSFKNPYLLAAYVSILITNFFGFSVVIIGLYFFLIPAFNEIE